jgi:cytochrome c553
MRVDQVSRYRASAHGRRLAAGVPGATTCVSCHGAHGILPESDPRSPTYARNVPTTCARCHGEGGKAGGGTSAGVVAAYTTSVHGRALIERGDLSAPACNDCHGGHGAERPQAASVALTCGTCHERQAELFRHTAKRRVLDEAGLPECSACHAVHGIQPVSDAMLGLGPVSICGRCHDRMDDPARRQSEQLADRFATLVDEVAELRRAEGIADGSAPPGSADAAEAHLVEARVLLHGFDTGRILAELDLGRQAARRALVAADGRGSRATLIRRMLVAAAALLLLGIALRLRRPARRAPNSVTHPR